MVHTAAKIKFAQSKPLYWQILCQKKRRMLLLPGSFDYFRVMRIYLAILLLFTASALSAQKLSKPRLFIPFPSPASDLNSKEGKEKLKQLMFNSRPIRQQADQGGLHGEHSAEKTRSGGPTSACLPMTVMIAAAIVAEVEQALPLHHGDGGAGGEPQGLEKECKGL